MLVSHDPNRRDGTDLDGCEAERQRRGPEMSRIALVPSMPDEPAEPTEWVVPQPGPHQ